VSDVISAFSVPQVVWLTGLSETQLRDWDASGFFRPAMAAEKRRTPYSRIYSFDDVVGLRVLNILRKEHSVSTQHLKDVAVRLAAYKNPWASLTLYVLNGEVHFRDPDTGKISGAVSGQYASLIPINSVVEDIKRKAESLRRRHQSQFGKIEQQRFVAHNAKVISGTRIPVATVRAFADAGYTTSQIIVEYPSLTEADVAAALSETNGQTIAA